jgi:hypothetical protein
VHAEVPGNPDWDVWAYYITITYNCANGRFAFAIYEGFLTGANLTILFNADQVYPPSVPNFHAMESISHIATIAANHRGFTSSGTGTANACSTVSDPWSVTVRLFIEDWI